MPFKEDELARQTAFREGGGFATGTEAHGVLMGRARPFAFVPEHAFENIFSETGAADTTREAARRYFEPIGWHHASAHLLSSQVCCVNFLGPFLQRPEALAGLLAPLFEGTVLRPLKLPGEPGYVAFEWIGETDYLNEQVGERPRTRGANCTSVDAAVLLDTADGRELLLVEWKYTERYGPRLGGGERARRVREGRYAELAFATHGPLRADLDLWLTDFFYEPLYQLLRQQMLAKQLEMHRYEGVRRVRVLHVSPVANTELGRITSPELRARFPRLDVFDAWSKVLVEPDRFLKMSREALFGAFPAADHGLREWRSYLAGRYGLAETAA